MQAKSESLLFLTRANKLEIFDYLSQKTLKTFTLKDDPIKMLTSSFYSPSKKLYVLHGQREVILFNIEELSIAAQLDIPEETPLLHFSFLDSHDELCFTVRRTGEGYLSTLYTLGEKSFLERKQFTTKLFLPHLRYLSFSESMQILFWQKTQNQLVSFSKKELDKEEGPTLEDEFPIHDFKTKGEFLFIASNNFNEGDKNKSIVKAFRIESDKLTRVVKRSFRNVQELTLIPSIDGS